MKELTGYTAVDVERYYVERASGTRTDFAKDAARVMHSAALRALADKTQVVAPGEGRSPRTRLTHSLEVAQIGRSLAAELGCNEDLVELAGLAHDIGHPPFGHNGERALRDYMDDAGGFEANAQNIRVLTLLEPKFLTPQGVSVGLNLTRASLDACIKYPFSYSEAQGQAMDNTVFKYGCYDADTGIFKWIRAGSPSQRVCLEAQIMNWADDIAYSVHDIEDGQVAGRVDLRMLSSEQDMVDLQTRHSLEEGISFSAAAGRLKKLEVVQHAARFAGSFSDYVAMKAFTSEMVGRFVTATTAATLDYYKQQEGEGFKNFTRYNADLIIPDEIRSEVALLKCLALEFIVSNTHHGYKQEIQRELIKQLTHQIEHDPHYFLYAPFRAHFDQAHGYPAQKRVICDFIASLTEREFYSLVSPSL